MPKNTKAAAALLSSFEVIRQGEDYLVSVEDESGQLVEFTASYEQLELISETLEKLLDEDEEAATEVDEDEDEDDAFDELGDEDE